MAKHSSTIAFWIDPRALLCWVLSLAALVSINASAAYTNCPLASEAGERGECFATQLQPQVAALTSNDSYADITQIAASNISVTNTDGAPISANVSFYVTQPRTSGERQPESLPLMLLLAALLAVWLVRAKNVNNK